MAEQVDRLASALSHRYSIERELGRGGMATVYLARDLKHERQVAVKVLHSELAAVLGADRFHREIKVTARLRHPHILPLLDSGDAGGFLFYAMPFAEGESLRDRLNRERQLPVDEALTIAREVADALNYAHGQGVIHRDIKPENILVESGHAVVADFGIARAINAAGGEKLTETGVAVGTTAYMSPEQAAGGSELDGRSDLYSLGCVLFEMLAGRPPFSGSTVASVVHQHLTAEPPVITSIRPAVSGAVAAALTRSLAKTPADRFSSGAQFAEALAACEARLAARNVPLRALLFRRAVLTTILALTIVILASGGWLWLQRSRVHKARTVALPEAARLIGEGRQYAAFRVLREAEAYIPDDPVLRDLLAESTTTVTVETTPPGARVEIRDFFEDPNRWDTLGRTPIANRRMAIGMLVWRVSADGFQTIEVLRGFPQNSTIRFALDRSGEVPTGMIRVPPGRLESIVTAGAVEVGGFWIDQYEVTNRRFKMFIDGGGYATRQYWTEPLLREDGPVSWDETMRIFRDPTGRPGPSTWELGTYPDGQADYPVGGLSWYESAAYCRSLGKDLPTVYHWYHAAFFAATNRFAAFGNFGSQGPSKIGHPLRLGRNGTYDMAGNVKEWSWNEGRLGRRYLLGGGWNEPSYMFHDYDAQRAFNRAPTNGVRCARYTDSPPRALMAPIEPVSRDYRTEASVSEEVFGVYRQSIYGYSPTPLDSRIASVDETPQHWRVERVNYAAAYGNERVPALLFLPKNRSGPHQAIVFFPGANAFLERAPMGDVGPMIQWISFLLRGGRAVLFPNYKGSYERFVGRMPAVSVWRDIMLYASKDLRRGVDYLETRPDIDAGRIAYYGLSMGGGAGPIMTALEPRFKASVLLGGGLYPWRWTPEADPLNFLSRVRVPTLMINGRHDYFFPVETSQRPMFDRLGTPASDKFHSIFESGHVPSERQRFIKDVLDWLDKYLGPVR